MATDANAAQVEKATPHKRVVYRTVLAEGSGLPDAIALSSHVVLHIDGAVDHQR